MTTNIRYAFAQIDGDTHTLVRHPTIKRDVVIPNCSDFDSFEMGFNNAHGAELSVTFLIPPEPVHRVPNDTLWKRIAKLRPIEYAAGDWQVWAAQDIPDTIRMALPGYISLFVVPLGEHEYLAEGRDQLSETRKKMISKRGPSKAPSSGAVPATFRADQQRAPIQLGRPKSSEVYPIPLALFVPAFARFQEHIRTGSIDHSIDPAAFEWRFKLSPFFDKEENREEVFHKMLQDLLGIEIVKAEIKNYQTGGGVKLPNLDLLVLPLVVVIKNESTVGNADAVFEAALYYREGVWYLLDSAKHQGDWRKTRLPTIILIHNGPNIRVYGGTWLLEEYVQVLSPSYPLDFNEFDVQAMEDLLRLMTALRQLFQSLSDLYAHPQQHIVARDQIEFPYPHSYPPGIFTRSSEFDESQQISFRYIERISSIRLIFTATTVETKKKIIVKFGYRHYGFEAHQAAVEAGLAPNLLSFSELDGGYWMVVMDLLPSGFEACDDVEGGLTISCANSVRTAVSRFHELDFVHGDMRDTNVFVRQQGKGWECLIIDYDWAGKKGEVKYPIGVYRNTAVWRPSQHMSSKLITVDDDLETVDEFLKRLVRA